MNNTILAVIIFSLLSSSTALADDISGGARADFSTQELIVPCVKIMNSGDEELDGHFFDIVLKQRGQSLNYEVSFGEPEESATCYSAIDAMLDSDTDTTDTEGSHSTEDVNDTNTTTESDEFSDTEVEEASGKIEENKMNDHASDTGNKNANEQATSDKDKEEKGNNGKGNGGQ